jgi:aryl-alcohol dehydrogenase-like predicted oxidoreductase
MDHRTPPLTRRKLLLAGAAGLGAGAFGAPLVWSAAATQRPLITRPIPLTGEQLPVIGLGTNAYSVQSAEDLAARREVLARMPELGGSVVDTARAYGESEVVIGQLVAQLGNRKRLFIASKTPMQGDFSQPDAIIEESFRRLQVEQIDLMQVHNLAGLEQITPKLFQWKEQGRIRYVGMSTSSATQYPDFIRAMRRFPFDFIQVDYSIANRNAAEQILPLAQERRAAVLINLPFGGRRGGNLFGRVSGQELPPWAAELDVHGWPEFFLKYVVSHPAVTCAIPGTTRLRNLESNQLAGRGRLPDEAQRRRMEAFWDEAFATEA